MFEVMWARDAECKEIVDLAWNPFTEDSGITIQERLEWCQSHLIGWNMNKFGNVNKILNKKQDLLQQLESLNMLHETAEEINAVRKEINELHIKEEIMWNQLCFGCKMGIKIRNSSIPLLVKGSGRIGLGV